MNRIILSLLICAAIPGVQAEDRVIETYGYIHAEPATGAARGRQVYEQWCIICHDTGIGMAGTEALMRKYKGSVPALLHEREGMTPAFIGTFVRNGVKSMPSFRKTEISEEDLEALGQYLSNPKAVQP